MGFAFPFTALEIGDSENHMDLPSPASLQPLGPRDRIDILLEEYRALNALLMFRLTAMDRRLPISVGFMAAAIAALLALPPDSRMAVLIITPPALLWLVRTTVQHARAKEDHLRRIDEIEQTIHSIAGEKLLVFQSHHPNRAEFAAGRTGIATLVATSSGAFGMLMLCLFLFRREATPLPHWLYLVYITAISIDVLLGPIALARYRYQKLSRVLVRE